MREEYQRQKRPIRVSIGCSQTPSAQRMAASFFYQETARGNQVVQHMLPCPVQGSWAVVQHGAEHGIFVEEHRGKLRLYHFDRNGIRQPLERDRRYGMDISPTTLTPNVEIRPLSSEQWARERAEAAAFRVHARPCRVTVAVEGEEAGQQALRAVLQQRGCRIEHRWRSGIPAFWMEQGGFQLTARDEKGVFVDSGQLLAVVTLIEMEQGDGCVALPAGSSRAAELVAAGYGGTVFHLDRDGQEGWEWYTRLTWLREAPSAAARICTRMGTARQSLEELLGKTPRFNLWKRETVLPGDRQDFVQALLSKPTARPEGLGVRLHIGTSWVHIRPHPKGERIQVLVEGPDLEQAEELCDWYVRHIKQWGGGKEEETES